MLRHSIGRGRVASQQLMKVNKEVLSEIPSPKASWRLAGCLPASYNLEMLADAGALAAVGEKERESGKAQ